MPQEQEDVNDKPASRQHPDHHVVSVRVPPDKAGERLDRFLASAVGGLSRTRLQRLIVAGRVTGLDGMPTLASTSKVRANETYTITIPAIRTGGPAPQRMDLDILFEDQDLIVINKPAGIVVHPAPGHPDGTLVNALLGHCGPAFANIGGVARPGIVHRLDMGTSGILVAAKSEHAYLALTRMFAAHTIERAYRTVVWGIPSARTGTIDGPIGRSPRNRKKMAILRRGGKPAITHYDVIHPLGHELALIECRLETGRTHQIRVHLTHIGHPIVGDPTYGRGRAKPESIIGAWIRQVNRPLLHACRLGFVHPVSRERVLFESPLPPIFDELFGLFE